jgi:capsular polysaccharide biosynthesis protein
MYAGMSFAFSMLTAIGWALFSEQLNPRVRTYRDLDDENGAPLLGTIPPFRPGRSEASLTET